MSFTPVSVTQTAVTAPTSHRWLKSHELLSLLSSPASYNLAFSVHPPLLPPPPGTLLLYNKSTCRRWRLDHRQWRMPERHVKLKVRGVERMNAIYAQQDDGAVCRRGYWLLDRKDVVLVHYVSKEAEAEGEGGVGEEVVKEEALDERKDVDVIKDTPQWLPQHEETKEPPPLLHPLSPHLHSHGLSVNPSDSFMSLSSTLLSPSFGSSPSAASSMPLLPLPSDELLSPQTSAASVPVVLDMAPGWDSVAGGVKLLLCCSYGHLFDPRTLHCIFGQQPARVQPITTGTYRVTVPPLSQHQVEVGRAVAVSLVLTDGRVSTPAVEFEYRPTASVTSTTAAAAPSHPSFPLPSLTQSPQLPSRTSSSSYAPPSLSACSTPRLSAAVGHPSRSMLPPGRELLSSLLSLLMSIERHLLLSSAAATCSFLSTFTLEDVQRLVQSHPSDDLLEGMLLSILHSLAPHTHSSASSTLHSPTGAATPTTSTSHHQQPPPTTHPSLLKLLTLSDPQGRQLVHLCASLGYLHLLSSLLDLGVSVHSPMGSGAALTPLHLAVMGGEEEVVRAVLAMGGEEGRLDGLGRSAVELARQLDKQRLVAVFRQVQEEDEERESRWQWEEVEDDEDDGSVGNVKFESHQHFPHLLSNAFTQPATLPMSPTASLSPISSYLSVSTIPPPLIAASSAAPSSSLPDAALSSSFSRLTLSDIGIDTSELSLHLQSLHPQPASFASFVSHTLTHVRSWLYRRHYAALTLQAAARGMLVRRRQKRLRESAVVIQQAVRRRKERQREATNNHNNNSQPTTQHRFQHLVHDMQQRVRRKRQEMEREAADAANNHGGGTGELSGVGGSGGVGDGMDVSGSGMSRGDSPRLEGFDGVGDGGIGGGGGAGVGAVGHLLPLSPMASSSDVLQQHWPD